MPAQPAAHAPIPPEVRRQAAAWLVELQSDGAGEQTRLDWQAWRAAHPDHERAWQRIEALGTKLQALQPGLAHAALASAGSPGRRRVVQGLAVALFAGGLAWAAQDRVPWRQWVADRRTGVGERATITLPDGTRVDLNSDSAVDIAFTDTERVLRLAAGEILVATAPDSHTPVRPFFVQTAEGRLQPLGTRFSVRQVARGESAVAVYEGAVRVQPRQGSALVLNAGQQASFTTARVNQPGAADEADTAWVQGMIVAQDMPLGDFIAELARHHPGWLGCAPSVADLKVTGTYPVDDTMKVLDMLTRTLPVQVRLRTRFWASVEPRGEDE
ncbi:FecR domain-containing protein [Ottowia sp.]|uniref:FecR domain-containing protein n=1 Tax=Ottowia sp. TaxID=1898956 RepID=UPI0039E2B412